MTTIVRPISVTLTQAEATAAVLEMPRSARAELFADVSNLANPLPINLGTPITTARQWTNALVPRTGGGWNYVSQSFTYPDLRSTEWLVTGLSTGQTSVHEDSSWVPGMQGRFANSNFTAKSQMRAANGRVFFPATQCWMFYYDPTDELVHDLGRVPGTVNDSLAYSLVFNPSGSMLYCGTLAGSSAPGRKPSVFTVDPNTLALTYLCQVGSSRTKNGYAYYLRVDGDWLYVLVGQEKWEIVAVHVPTKTATTLEVEAGPAPMAYFRTKPEGVSIELVRNLGAANQTSRKFWCVDGALVPYVDGYNPTTLPFTPRNVVPYSNPLVSPPLIDDSQMPHVIRWRTATNLPWNDVQLPPVHTSPIPIESLLATPGGAILGEATQYGGHFIWDGTAFRSTSNQGTGLGNGNAKLWARGKAYLAGYPNGVLLEVDTVLPFSDINPKPLGNFTNGVTLSAVKRATVLGYHSARDRLYMGGVRDRNGFGAGVGWYDFASKTYGGTYAGLNNFTEDISLVVLSALDLVVLSGRIGDDPLDPSTPPIEAQLVIYNGDLTELERQTPLPGLPATRHLFPCATPGVVVGVADQVVYQWDVIGRRLLRAESFAHLGALGPVSEGPAGIVATMGATLVLVNPDALTITALGQVNPLKHLAQSGQDVYAAADADLLVFRGVL